MRSQLSLTILMVCMTCLSFDLGAQKTPEQLAKEEERIKYLQDSIVREISWAMANDSVNYQIFSNSKGGGFIIRSVDDDVLICDIYCSKCHTMLTDMPLRKKDGDYIYESQITDPPNINRLIVRKEGESYAVQVQGFCEHRAGEYLIKN